MAEDAPVGAQSETGSWENDVDVGRIRPDAGVGGEVLAVLGHVGGVAFGGHRPVACHAMSYEIRTYGDPVLKSRAARVENVDGKVARLVKGMFDTLTRTDNGLALAAPQIGVRRQVVVWDLGEDPLAIINPEVVESDGEWVYDEGCLSIPGLYVEMMRPKTVLVRGVDLAGEIIEIEADELEARMFQHEIDHLEGVLIFDRLEGDQRRDALAEYRRLEEQAAAVEAARPALRRRLGLG